MISPGGNWKQIFQKCQMWHNQILIPFATYHKRNLAKRMLYLQRYFPFDKTATLNSHQIICQLDDQTLNLIICRKQQWQDIWCVQKLIITKHCQQKKNKISRSHSKYKSTKSSSHLVMIVRYFGKILKAWSRSSIDKINGFWFFKI